MGTALSCAVISCDSLIEAGVHSQVLSLSSPPAHLFFFKGTTCGVHFSEVYLDLQEH